MPNRKYRKGYRKELEIVNTFRRAGWISARTAGSHSPFDLFAWNPKHRIVRFVQVKTKGRMKHRHITNHVAFSGCDVITWTEVYD